MNFKPGDRVKLKEDCHSRLKVGSLGTVGPRGVYKNEVGTWVNILWDSGFGHGGYHLHQVEIYKPKTRLEDLILS